MPEHLQRTLGRIEAMILAHHQEVMRHIMLMHRKISAAKKRRAPWAAIAAVAFTATTSLLGFLSPETAAALLRALLQIP
jgi:hypothetical protein